MVPCCFGRRQLKVVHPKVRHFAELFSATMFYIVMNFNKVIKLFKYRICDFATELSV